MANWIHKTYDYKQKCDLCGLRFNDMIVPDGEKVKIKLCFSCAKAAGSVDVTPPEDRAMQKAPETTDKETVIPAPTEPASKPTA